MKVPTARPFLALALTSWGVLLIYRRWGSWYFVNRPFELVLLVLVALLGFVSLNKLVLPALAFLVRQLLRKRGLLVAGLFLAGWAAWSRLPDPNATYRSLDGGKYQIENAAVRKLVLLSGYGSEKLAALVLPSVFPYSALLLIALFLLMVFASGWRGRLVASLLLALFPALLAAYFSSRQEERYVVWWPKVRTWDILGYRKYNILRETPEGFLVRNREAPSGTTFYSKTVINAHFHDYNKQSPPCYLNHAKPDLYVYSEAFHPSYGSHFFSYWWPLFSVALAVGWFILKFPFLGLVQEALVRHPIENEIPKRKRGETLPPRIDPVKVAARTYSPKEGLPPVWKSEMLKRRLDKLKARVEAENNLMTKLIDYLRLREALDPKRRSKDARRD